MTRTTMTTTGTGSGTAGAAAVVDTGLPPALLALLPLARRLRPWVRRLPIRPPGLALAVALDRWLLPRLPGDVRGRLSGPVVDVEVTDLGMHVRLRLDARGFHEAGDASGTPALRIAATAPALWRLVRGEDDADRLFFERQLVMEGDTELGLVLKNTLDAIGPWWGPGTHGG